MKKTLLFSALLVAFGISHAQNQPINFEPGGQGANWTWTVFENDDNPPVEIIANPDPSGANTSATVAKFTARVTGNPWAGCESNSGADLGPFVLSADNSTIKIMVWKSVISDVGIKLASPTGWAQPEIKVANTLVNQWEEITFNFAAYVNPPVDQGQLSQIIVFPDFNLSGRAQDNIVFFDNITFSAANPIPEPMTPAPTPTQDAANVISLFSDAYTNVPVDTWLTGWSAAALTDVSIQGNATKRYANLDFAGIETVGNQLDITGMTHFHVDVWSADFTFFGIKIVDFGANGVFDGGDDVEHQVNFNNPAQQQWVSLDIPLTSFTGLTTQSNIAQYIIVGQPSGNTVVFLDNMYFYTGSPVVEAPTEPAPTPIHLQANVISLFSDAYTNVSVDTWRTDWSAADLEDITIQGNPTKKYTNLDFVGIETVASPVNASSMEFFHMDIWTPNATSFGVKLVDFGANGVFDGGGDDSEHQINITAPEQQQWVSLDLPLSSFTGLESTEHIAQYILVGQPTGLTTVFVDNVYFYRTVVNVDDLKVANMPGLYPNPAAVGQDVRFGDAKCQIEVYDISGRLVHASLNTYLQTNNLNPGIYLVKLRTEDGNQTSQRLIMR